jgi:hypothetical protein
MAEPISYLDGLIYGLRDVYVAGVGPVAASAAVDLVGSGWAAVFNPSTGRIEVRFTAPSQIPDGFPSYQKITRLEVVDHFLRVISTNTDPISFTQSGAGAGASSAAPPVGRIGIVQLSTGTTATGVSAAQTDMAMAELGNGRHRLRWDVALQALSDGTETFTTRVGFIDSAAAESTDAVMFRYNHAVNGGKWECVTRSNGVETATDSGVVPNPGSAAANYQVFEIEVNAAATSAAFYINGNLVGTIATNIPAGAGRRLGIGAFMLKSAGLTARTMSLDLVTWIHDPTVAL